MSRMKLTKRFAIKSSDDFSQIGRAIWNPKLRDWGPVIEDLIEISRKRSDHKLSMTHLQADLLTHLILRSKEIIAINQVLKSNKITDEEGNEFQLDDAQIEDFKRQRLSLYAIMSIIRDIGDGILWRSLGFNRPLLYMLMGNQKEELVDQNHGLVTELTEIEEIVHQDNTANAIITHTTNFLRIGDFLTVFKDGNLELVEVKAGRNPRGKKWKERIERQVQRMEEIVEFSETGEFTHLGKQVVLKTTQVKLKNHLAPLRDIVFNARKNGSSYRKCDTHLVLGCIYYDSFMDTEKRQNFLGEIEKKHIKKWKDNGDIVIPHISIDRFDWSHNWPPISVFPFPPSLCADILTGKAILKFYVNLTEIFRKFQAMGWQVEDSIENRLGVEPDPIAEHLFSLKKGARTVKLPPDLTARLFFETLDPSVLIRMLEDSEVLAPETGYARIRFDTEGKIWK